MIHKQMISFMLIQISFNKKILIKEKYISCRYRNYNRIRFVSYLSLPIEIKYIQTIFKGLC